MSRLYALILVLAASHPISADCQDLRFEDYKLFAADEASGDLFGRSVGLGSDWLIVGSPYDEQNGYRSGAAYAFHWNGMEWQQTQKLRPSGLQAEDMFGWSVAIDGDLAAIGATGDDDAADNSGAVYLFRLIGSRWTEEQKLVGGGSTTGDQVGEHVTVSKDKWVIMNGQYPVPVLAFRYADSSWVETESLYPDDGGHPNFGHSLSIAGAWLAIGAPYGAGVSDRIYMYRCDQQACEEFQTIKPSETGIMHFGWSIGIDDSTALVGATRPDDSNGSAYFFRFEGATWSEAQWVEASDGEPADAFSATVAINGAFAVVGAPYDDDNGMDSGSAYLFRYDGQGWIEDAKLLASDGEAFDGFSKEISCDSNWIVVSAIGDDDRGDNAGSVYLFRTNVSTGVTNDYPGSHELRLGYPFPNPARDRISLMVDVARPALVEMFVYDILGRQVIRTGSRFAAAGQHEFYIDATNLLPGIYIIRANQSREVRHLAIVR